VQQRDQLMQGRKQQVHVSKQQEQHLDSNLTCTTTGALLPSSTDASAMRLCSRSAAAPLLPLESTEGPAVLLQLLLESA
jgi:hypothetical protein